jgi:putative tricarboxylic transport membrane protein
VTLNRREIVAGASAVGGWDQTGRSIEAAMKAEKIIETFQFEHAPGAGGAVGLPKFLGARRGQANSLMVGGMVMVGALIANKTPVKLSDTTPIARLTGEAEVIVVPAESPFKSLKDLMEALKKEPGKVSWAGGSAGGTDHIFVGMLCRAVGVEPKAASYVAFSGGGPALAALLGNQVSAGVSGYAEFAEQVKAGKLRVLGISSDQRIAGIDAPTLKEQGVDVVLFNWRGVFGAPGITPAQRDGLIDVINKMVASASWKKTLEEKGWVGIHLSGDAFGKYLADETVRITAILKDLGLAT